MGVEKGEYVGTSETDENLDRSTRLQTFIVISGLIATIFRVSFIAALAVIVAEFFPQVVMSSGFGSIQAALLGIMASIVVVDVIVSKLTLSPIGAPAGIFAVSITLPIAIIYLYVQDRSQKVNNGEELALLAGDRGVARVLAARLYKRQGNGPSLG
jgi:hypothetical protein